MQSTRLSLRNIHLTELAIGRRFLFAAEGDDEDEEKKDLGGDAVDETGGAGGSDDDKGGDPQKKITALEDEKNRHFEARRKAEEELAKLQKFKDEVDKKGRTEIENLQHDLEVREARIAELEKGISNLVVKTAFLENKDYEWHNPERALALVDLSEVEVGEDGSVKNPDVLKAAIKKLADEEPYMLKPKNGEDDDKKDKPGIKTGDAPKPKPKSDDKAKLEALKSKYPALKTRG